MRRLAVASLLAAGLLCLGPPPAGAAGLGVYGGGAGGDILEIFGNDVATHHGEVGVVLDTAPARGSVFHYRLAVGYDRLTADEDGGGWDAGSEARLNGVVVDNTFGFRVFERPAGRLWLGPQVRLGYYRGEGEYPDGMGGAGRTRVHVTAVGAGPVVGADWNLSDHLTLALTGGWRMAFYNGSEHSEGVGGSREYENFAEALWFFQACVFARFGE